MKRFIAGTTRKEVVALAHELSRQGFSPLVNIVGEHAKSPSRAEAATKEYQELVADLAPIISARIAVKPSLIGALVGGNALERNFAAIAESCQRNNVALEIDVENEKLAAKTVALALRAQNEFGIATRATVAARLTPDSDIQKLIAARVPVRLVKGAYANQNSPLYNKTSFIQKRFCALVTKLLAHGTDPAFATHDAALIDFILTEAERLNKSSSDFEFQFLWGLRKKRAQKLKDEGWRVTFYLPYGKDYLAYALRRWRYFFTRPRDFLAAFFG